MESEQYSFTNPSNERFFNTPHLQGEELKVSAKRAINQDGIVLNYFMTNSPYCFTASDVIKGLLSVNIKESSIRRAITNLCHERQPFLVKTEVMKKSPWGVNEHFYKLIKA